MSTPSYVLRVARAKQAPADMEFAHPRVTIGREAGDIALHDAGASSRHAEVDFHAGAVTLRDVGSTNGTWVGSRKVTAERMQPGLVFTIGSSTIELIAVKGLEPVGTLVMPGPMAAVGTEIRPNTAVQAQRAPSATRSALSSARKQQLMIGGGIAVLALILFFAFSGGGGGGSGSSRALTKTSEATVKAVWFKGPPGPQASGGTSPSTVRISPNSKDGASVGVLEEFAGGAGNQWRTATWLAAFSASQLTGLSLTDHEFLVRTGGHIDGPSAGMLMTATMIALLRGKTPRADTTMTGTINPDGSAGPVGGIVQKMEGASKDGIKRFGFPMGARNHQDLRNGRTVDLFDAGKEFGLEVREIRDVFEAYEFLTDDKLVRPEPVAESEMELDGNTSSRLRAKNQGWTARLKGEIANLGSVARGLGEELGKILQPLAQQADAAYKRAQDFERSDFLASSYEAYVQAAVLAGMTKDLARFLKSKDDQPDLIAQVEAAATVRGQLDAAINEVEVQAKSKTGGGQVNTLRAYHALVIAEAFTSIANGAVDVTNKLIEAQKKGELSAEQQQQLIGQLYNAMSNFSIAKTMLEVSRDQQDFGNEEGQSPPLDSKVIGKAAAAYGSAAGAVLAYLESLTIDDAAREAGVDKATAQNRLAQNDQDYLLAFRAVRIAEGITDKKNESNLLRLAAGSMAFLKGASLINKYYSLGGQRDQAGAFVLTNRKALSAQLDLARQLAREAAAKAKQAVGFVPMAARFAYQLGVAKREGDDEEKLAALEAYWESAFWSELAAGRTGASTGAK